MTSEDGLAICGNNLVSSNFVASPEETKDDEEHDLRVVKL